MSRSFGSTWLTMRPSMAIVPPLISSSPAIIRSVVDLPQPEGPTRTMNSRSSTVRLISLTARTPEPLFSGKILSRFSMTTLAMRGYERGRARAG